MCVCGIDIDVVSQYMVYMVYNCVYYCMCIYVLHTYVSNR
jgi:hypothetical protein